MKRYAEDVDAEYRFETNSVFYTGGCAGGPAMDRFQLLEERYDAYDQIVYLDTDILISPRAPDIFRVAEGAAIAGINRIHPRDRELLDHGWLIDEDARRVAEEPDSALRFPVYDQSLVSYFLTKSPFTLTRLSKSFLRGPFFYHHGGGKDDHRVMRYFERYEKLAKRWERTRPGNTRGLLKSLQVAYLRRTTPKPASPQPAHSPTVESSSSRLPSGSRK